MYCLVALSGTPLPWDTAAAGGDCFGCIMARVGMMADPSESGALTDLPEALQRFGGQVLRSCFDYRCDTETSLRSWLREASLRNARSQGLGNTVTPCDGTTQKHARIKRDCHRVSAWQA